MTKLREEYEQMATGPVPWAGKELQWDQEDAFSYIADNGVVVGWNRNTEIFWRNRDAQRDEGRKEVEVSE